MDHFWIALFTQDGVLETTFFRKKTEKEVRRIVEEEFGCDESPLIEEIICPTEGFIEKARWEIALRHLDGLGDEDVMRPSPQQIFEYIYLLGYRRGEKARREK